MGNWAKWSEELQNILRLRSKIVGFRKLENAQDLEKINNVIRIKKHLFTFCQVLFMVRVGGLTVGVTRLDSMLNRCTRIVGLKTAREKSMRVEAESLATTWFASPEDSLKQQADYSRIPAVYEGAIVAAPLIDEKFDPEVILIYGNPAQVMMLMCGLQKEKYENFESSFIGEGSCSNSLAECYVTGKPRFTIPCYGERAIGQVADDELVIALPPGVIERALIGLQKLAKIGLEYPIKFIGGEADVYPLLSKLYPNVQEHFKADAKDH